MDGRDVVPETALLNALERVALLKLVLQLASLLERIAGQYQTAWFDYGQGHWVAHKADPSGDSPGNGT